MLYEWIRTHRPTNCLELGFAYGVSTVYIAAALEDNGHGRLTSVDNLTAHDRVPTASDLVRRAGLEHRVDLVYETTSYNWFLHRTLRQRSKDGAIEPIWDFCFLDGGHTWLDDGLSFHLVDRLLRPGGWILFDDLTWKPDHERFPDVPDEERQLAQVGEVFELLAATHPHYDRIETDGEWGWAHKSESPNPAIRTVVKRDMLGAALAGFRLVKNRLRR